MSYKYELFQKAIKLERDFLPDSKKSKKQQKISMNQFMYIMDELFANGWRNEYDMWTQNIKE